MSFVVIQTETPREKARREERERERNKSLYSIDTEEGKKKADDEFYKVFDYFIR